MSINFLRRIQSADDVGTEEPAEQVVAVVHEGRALVVGDDPVQVSHVLAVLENGRQDSLASKEQFVKVSEGSLENLAASPSKLRWYIDPFKFAAAYKLRTQKTTEGTRLR